MSTDDLNKLKVFIEYDKRRKENVLAQFVSVAQNSPVPWTNELINGICSMSEEQYRQALKYHPGWEIMTKWHSINTLFKIQKKNYQDLISSLITFHEKAQEKDFFSRKRDVELEATVFLINKNMFNFLMSSDAVGDVAKPGSKNSNPFCRLANYGAEFKKYYINHTLFQFMRCLRNSLAHDYFFSASFQIKFLKEEKYTNFNLKSSDLSKSPYFKKSARKFIQGAGQVIDIRQLSKEYFDLVIQFYNWLENIIFKDEAYKDYKKILGERKNEGMRNFWKIILQQLESRKNVDMYTYLDDNFTNEELALINQFPKHSKVQIDKIIELYDKTNACTSNIRERVYKLFKIKDA